MSYNNKNNNNNINNNNNNKNNNDYNNNSDDDGDDEDNYKSCWILQCYNWPSFANFNICSRTAKCGPFE